MDICKLFKIIIVNRKPDNEPCCSDIGTMRCPLNHLLILIVTI